MEPNSELLIRIDENVKQIKDTLKECRTDIDAHDGRIQLLETHGVLEADCRVAKQDLYGKYNGLQRWLMGIGGSIILLLGGDTFKGDDGMKITWKTIERVIKKARGKDVPELEQDIPEDLAEIILLGEALILKGSLRAIDQAVAKIKEFGEINMEDFDVFVAALKKAIQAELDN